MGEEIGFVGDVVQYGPLYTGLILFFWFMAYKWWPWFVGPRQEQLDSRWRAKQEQDKDQVMQVKNLTDRVISLFEEHQNGVQRRNEDAHDRIEKAIVATHTSAMQTLERYAVISAERENQLQEWIKDTVKLSMG